MEKIQKDEIYSYLRDRDTDPVEAKQELDKVLDRIITLLQNQDTPFYVLCITDPQFKEELSEEIFNRTYQDYYFSKSTDRALSESESAPDFYSEPLINGDSEYGSFISDEEFFEIYLSSVLKRTGFEGGLGRIYELYLTDPSTKEAISFLKKEYGIGGGTEFFPNGKRGFSNHDSKGIEISVKLDDGEYSRTVTCEHQLHS